MRVLQQEPGRTVFLEDSGHVRKVFTGADPETLTRLAAREFEHMTLFAEALTDIDAAACPRPLEMGGGVAPFIVMDHAIGEPLRNHLNSPGWDRNLEQHIARVLAAGLFRYIDTFGEPYWDFIFRNMFYDRSRDLVTFIDFGVPVLYEPAMRELRSIPAVEVSLGGLVASSVFESARPRYLYRRREHGNAPALAGRVLRQVLEHPAGHRVSAEGVLDVARTTYALASRGGGRARRTWYGTVGSVLAGAERKFSRIAVKTT